MCDYDPGNSDALGDTLYSPRSGKQSFINWAWDAFDFDKGDWDDGWGFHAAWDKTLPLNRTLSGIWCMTYSAGSSPNSSISGPNILAWGWKYAQTHLDELDGACTNGDAVARTVRGVDDYTELYLKYFQQAVSLRAGTLVHEARHAAGTSHDSGNNDSSWEFNGAWRFQVCWLARFANDGQFTTAALRTLARQRANTILANNFASPPGFSV